MPTKCSKGQIERVGYSYTRKKSSKKVKVKSTCITDKGKPGKGPKLITIPEYDVGLLSKYGYSLSESHERRVKSLKKAIKENSELKILRHINALRTLLKSNPKLYNKLDKDMKWIQKDYQTKKGGSNDTKTCKKDDEWSLINFNNSKDDDWSLINFKKSSKKGSKKSKK